MLSGHHGPVRGMEHGDSVLISVMYLYRTIRVWEYTQESCVLVLSGHHGPVRGVLWNTEIPYLLMSGSWDYRILIWDTRDGACVETLLDHGADVYGRSKVMKTYAPRLNDWGHIVLSCLFIVCVLLTLTFAITFIL